jgi:cell division protein FtsB
MAPEDSRKNKNKRKKKIKNYLYWIIFFSIIIYTFFFTRYNLLSCYQTRKTNKLLKEEYQSLKINNEELKKQIEDLKNNPEAWERIAREKYGMQKKGEKIIIFRRDEE